ncbi:Actin-like protein 9 [Echinococcus granulosus]|uniref:Actin protein 9 n=2 Tax=Echinococcus granulosus TaxID=6210 RepID=A0A068WYU4_ECHGR|nr:Actin-like protein 9 [Echinococcus granulosus]CDS23694.1 actin protein 9 [Echinococcus granulosus]
MVKFLPSLDGRAGVKIGSTQTANQERMRELLIPTAPIVIDPGTYRWRVGFANLDKPKSSFLTETSMLNGTAVEEDGRIKRFDSTELSLKYFERYVNHALRFLHCDPHSVSLCLALPLAFTPAYRNQLAEVLLEHTGVKSIFFASQPLLSGFSSGKPTCLVVDSGYSYSSVYGLFDLYPERSSEIIYSLGGRNIDTYLKQLAGVKLNDSTPAEIDYIKSHFCSVASKPLSSSPSKKSSKNAQSCQMPDGQLLKLGNELKLAPELIFSPGLNGYTKVPSMETAVLEAASQLPNEKSNALLTNVILSGGNSKFKGLEQRLKAALPNCNVQSHLAKDLGVWRGGQIFASMPTFSSMVITRERWKEYGEDIVQKKWL